MSRAIAIDYGDKRCGIALEVEMIATPKEILLRVDIIEILKKYFVEYPDIDRIVVGLPFDLFGKDLKQLNKTKEFIRELENKFGKKSKSEKKYRIIGIDERFTSFEADNTLKQFGKIDNYGNKDDISAVLILETYISNKHKYE